MMTLVGVGILAVLWAFAVTGVIGLVRWFGQDALVEHHPTTDLVVGLLFVTILALAPLALLVLLRVN